jgi:hypothetical protein
VRDALRNRLTFAGLLLVALSLAICAVARHQLTFETSLNLLWVLLVCGAFAYWVAAGNRRRSVHPLRLVSLVFVLSLLFPVISANDDLAQMDLINDAKSSESIASSLKNDKQLRGSAGLLGSPAALALKLPPLLFLHPFASEFVLEPVHGPCLAAVAGSATGNHSPPLC